MSCSGIIIFQGHRLALGTAVDGQRRVSIRREHLRTTAFLSHKGRHYIALTGVMPTLVRILSTMTVFMTGYLAEPLVNSGI